MPRIAKIMIATKKQYLFVLATDGFQLGSHRILSSPSSTYLKHMEAVYNYIKLYMW